MSSFPFVIWAGRNPLHKKNSPLFRLVARGPARETRKDDVPFGLEVRANHDFMKEHSWLVPSKPDTQREAIWALAHALGSILAFDPKQLNLSHPLHCEINMALFEGRPCKGCDCNSPPDPMRKQDIEIQVNNTKIHYADGVSVEYGTLAILAGFGPGEQPTILAKGPPPFEACSVTPGQKIRLIDGMKFTIMNTGAA